MMMMMMTQGLVTVRAPCADAPGLENAFVNSCGNLTILQCVPTPAAVAPWYQRNFWIFIIIAVAAAAVVVALAWCDGSYFRESGLCTHADVDPPVKSTWI